MAGSENQPNLANQLHRRQSKSRSRTPGRIVTLLSSSERVVACQMKHEPETQQPRSQPHSFRTPAPVSGICLLTWAVHCAIGLLLLTFAPLGLGYWHMLNPTFDEDVELFENMVKPGDQMLGRIWLGPDCKGPRAVPDFNFTYDQGLPEIVTNLTILLSQNQLESGVNPSVSVMVLHVGLKKSRCIRRSVIREVKLPPQRPTFSLFDGYKCAVDREPSRKASHVLRGIPEMRVGLVYDTASYPNRREFIREAPYFPDVIIEDLGMLDDTLVKLNTTGDSTFETRVSLAMVSPVRKRFQMVMRAGFSRTEKFFGNETEESWRQEMNQMRDLYANSNPYLLVATVIVSVLHLIFEFLAFKNDVIFFQGCDPADLNKYVSIRSILLELVMQFFILLYLMDEGANFLVWGPSAMSIAVDAWKVQRAMQLRWITCGVLWLPMLRPRVQPAEQEDLDFVIVQRLALFVSPFVLLYGLHTFVQDCHRGWHSFVLHVAATCAYSGGFVLMTPQLFMNYRHKSVAHTPWRKLAYRATSTFIDDLFAFMIRMPTMHRLSCFRDDIVFVLYLIQRWMYPSS